MLETTMTINFIKILKLLHYTTQDPEVYNEEYDERIFCLLKAAKGGELGIIKRWVYNRSLQNISLFNFCQKYFQPKIKSAKD